MKIIKKLFFIFCFVSLWSFSVGAHPFYVSICQIDFNKENQTLEIAVKTFSDDLLLGLENAGATKIYLGEKRENPATDDFIFDYFKTKLKVKVNGKSFHFSFVGKEIESDVVWSYLEIEGVSAVNEIEVECDLLTEVLESQRNIIQINDGNGIKNLLLSKRKTKDSIVY